MSDETVLNVTKLPKFSDASDINGFFWVLESNESTTLTSGKESLFKTINKHQQVLSLNNSEPLPEIDVEDHDPAGPAVSGELSTMAMMALGTQATNITNENQRSQSQQQLQQEPTFDISTLWSREPSTPPAQFKPPPIAVLSRRDAMENLKSSAAAILEVLELSDYMDDFDLGVMAAHNRLQENKNIDTSTNYAYGGGIEEKRMKRGLSEMRRAEACLQDALLQIPPGWITQCRQVNSYNNRSSASTIEIDVLDEGVDQPLEEGSALFSVGEGTLTNLSLIHQNF